MAISKIQGQILSDNLTRSGINLAIETDLLFFDVTNDRIGIKDGTPSDTLSVTGTTGLTGTLTVSGNSTLATAKISDLTSGRIVYAGTAGELQDNANLTFNGTTLSIDNISAETGNSLTISADTNLNLSTENIIYGHKTIGDTKINLFGNKIHPSIGLANDQLNIGYIYNQIEEIDEYGNKEDKTNNKLSLDLDLNIKI